MGVQQLQGSHAQAHCRCCDVCRRYLRLPDGLSILVQEPAVWEAHIEGGFPELPPLNIMAPDFRNHTVTGHIWQNAINQVHSHNSIIARSFEVDL